MENIVLMVPDYLHGIEDSEVQQFDGVRLRDAWICLGQMTSDMWWNSIYYQTKFMIQLELIPQRTGISIISCVLTFVSFRL